jgi:hypothetical protein
MKVLLTALAAVTLLLAGCERERVTRTPERTLPPGVKLVTPTEELPTVEPATPTPTPGVLDSTAFDPAGLEVTLPVRPGTAARVVERCFWDECWGYALPPGTPVMAPMSGKVTIGPSAQDTTCSIVLTVFQSTDSESGKLTEPPESVEMALGCDAALEVANGDEVERGGLLARLGQRGLYEGRGDAPPTVLRFTCNFEAKPCNWAGGSPHYFVPDEEPTPTGSPTPTATGSPAPAETGTAEPTPTPTG